MDVYIPISKAHGGHCRRYCGKCVVEIAGGMSADKNRDDRINRHKQLDEDQQKGDLSFNDCHWDINIPS